MHRESDQTMRRQDDRIAVNRGATLKAATDGAGERDGSCVKRGVGPRFAQRRFKGN